MVPAEATPARKLSVASATVMIRSLRIEASLRSPSPAACTSHDTCWWTTGCVTLLTSVEGSGEHRMIDINALVEESLNLAWHGARPETQGFEIKLKLRWGRRFPAGHPACSS